MRPSVHGAKIRAANWYKWTSEEAAPLGQSGKIISTPSETAPPWITHSAPTSPQLYVCLGERSLCFILSFSLMQTVDAALIRGQ